MATKSGIEWTKATWNPSVGCTKISPGCKFCYASTMHRRLTTMVQPKYADPFSVVKAWEAHLNEPLKWREPRLIFVNSMSRFVVPVASSWPRAWTSHVQRQATTSSVMGMIARLLWPFLGRKDVLDAQGGTPHLSDNSLSGALHLR